MKQIQDWETHSAHETERADAAELREQQALLVAPELRDGLCRRVEALLVAADEWAVGWVSRDSGEVCNAEGVRDLIADIRTELARNSPGRCPIHNGATCSCEGGDA